MSVTSIITRFRLCPDHRTRTAELFGQIVAPLRQFSPNTEEQLVTWDGLERITKRFVGSAQAIGHPIGVHSPEFWNYWRQFINRNERLSTRRRAGRTQITKTRFSTSNPNSLATSADDGNELGRSYQSTHGPA